MRSPCSTCGCTCPVCGALPVTGHRESGPLLSHAIYCPQAHPKDGA